MMAGTISRPAAAGDGATAAVDRLLAIYWAIETAQAGAPPPDRVWQDMLAKAPLYFRQVAQQQPGIAARLAGRDWRRALGEAVARASRRSVAVRSLAPRDAAGTAGALTLRIAEALVASTALPRLCLVRLALPDGVHCIAVAAGGGRLYVFDPHSGVTVIGPQRNGSLAGILQGLFADYRPRRAHVAALT